MNKSYLKTYTCTFFAFLLLIISARAQQALDITKDVSLNCTGIELRKITDDNIATHSKGENVRIEVISEMPLEGIYIKYNKTPSPGLLNGNTPVAENGFLHEFIHLNGKTSAVVSHDSTDICDIKVLSSGTLPEDIQIWEKGKSETDILLCATHSDDDQLFFAGLLPYYAKHIGANVRVAYFINHFDTYNRTHELLDGLWHCGVRNYPDISPFPDGYSENISQAQQFLASKGFEYTNLINFQKELLNKYKPLVAVLHDFDGEYGHGAHMLNTKTFIEAYENAGQSDYIPEKVYVHLYDNNTITLPIDTPLSSLDEKSPFQVSQEAFGFHKSQHWTWFYNWIYGKNENISKASQISRYSPMNYGLYYSRVGEDMNKNDMLENIITYAERERTALREAEKKALREKQAQEQKELLLKEQMKKEEERKQALIKESKNNKLIITSIFTLSVLVLSIIIIIAIIKFKNKKKR